jgi:hypothetical protein
MNTRRIRLSIKVPNKDESLNATKYSSNRPPLKFTDN